MLQSAKNSLIKKGIQDVSNEFVIALKRANGSRRPFLLVAVRIDFILPKEYNPFWEVAI